MVYPAAFNSLFVILSSPAAFPNFIPSSILHNSTGKICLDVNLLELAVIY
jgi:hypothetical protein